jgi:hypothetical protein
MKIFKKSMGVAALITAGVVVVGLAPEASMAASKHKAKRSAAAASSSPQSSVERRLRAMEDEINALRSELNRTRSEARTQGSAKVQELESRQQQLEQQVAEAKEHEEEHHDLLFFRGGYAQMEHARGNELLTSNNALSNLTGTPNSGRNGDGWYVGAGFDHTLTDDFWGLTDIASVDGEVMFEYKNFGQNHNGFVSAQLAGLGAGSQGIKNQITQFTLTAAPKIKFNNLGIFRPWIIPFGLGIHVISPPSSGVTVLNPGLMLGTGMEVNIWKSLWAGIDFRYHFTGDDLNYKYNVGSTTVLNKVDTDGFTTGAYLGFGF